MSPIRLLILAVWLAAGISLASEPVRTVREPTGEPAAARASSPVETALREISAVEKDVSEIVASHGRYERSAVQQADLIRRLTEAVERTTRTLTTRPRPSESAQATALRNLAKLNDALRLEFLALQNSMQMESRQFHAVSSALKVKHETAKAAINNVR